MFADELEVKKVSGVFEPLNVEDFSVDELEQYQDDMRCEIERIDSEISQKKASAQAANAFFK